MIRIIHTIRYAQACQQSDGTWIVEEDGVGDASQPDTFRKTYTDAEFRQRYEKDNPQIVLPTPIVNPYPKHHSA